MAAAHGFRRTSATVCAADGASLEIRESEPRRAIVRVTDAAGRPVPGARVTAAAHTAGDRRELWSLPWISIAQFDGTTEVATPRTGADGTVALDVSDGAVRYLAVLAGASASLLSDDDEVDLVLGPPSQDGR